MLLPVLPHVFQLLFQERDARPDLAAIDFQLRLAGAAQAHAGRARSPCPAAGLPHQVRPAARQARQPVFVLRQLDLQRAFARVRVLREDVEDQRRPIEHARLLAQFLLQVALMARRQLVVKQGHFKAQLGLPRLQLFDFALPDKGRRLDPLELLRHLADDLQPGRVGQGAQFFERIFHGQQMVRVAHVDANQKRAQAGRCSGYGFTMFGNSNLTRQFLSETRQERLLASLPCGHAANQPGVGAGLLLKAVR